jgi:pilus assembly protein Flp/PilA
MRKRFSGIVKTFARDESGASLLEYTILLGIITAVSVGLITQVGGWVTGRWNALVTALGLS